MADKAEKPKPQPTEKPKPQPKGPAHQSSQKFSPNLVGRRVVVQSFDWSRSITGTLIKDERYIYVLKLDTGGTLGFHKHSVGAIGPLKGGGGGDAGEG